MGYGNKQRYWQKDRVKRRQNSLKAGFHQRISISISLHTEKQKDADNEHLLLEKLPTKNANYQHLTASVYVDVCLCLCASENQPFIEATKIRKSGTAFVTFLFKKDTHESLIHNQQQKLGITRLCFELFIAWLIQVVRLWSYQVP